MTWLARGVNGQTPPMLPFDLPLLTRGFAELTPAAAALGKEAAVGAASALARLLGCKAQVSGHAVPGHSSDGTACARLTFDLPALSGTAVLEVDASLVARTVDRAAGGDGRLPGATALTPVETSMLELMALASLEALSRLEPIEHALSPRLTRDGATPASPLCVALEMELGDERGRGRLLLPPAAVRALGKRADLPEPLARTPIDCSVRQGGAILAPHELASFRAGDVLLLDSTPAEHLILPGGHRVRGRIAGDRFHVEEVQ